MTDSEPSYNYNTATKMDTKVKVAAPSKMESDEFLCSKNNIPSSEPDITSSNFNATPSSSSLQPLSQVTRPQVDNYNSNNDVIPKLKENVNCKGSIWSCHLDPRVVDLIYWKDWKLTGAVLFSSFIFLLSLALFSVLSVVAYLLLITLTITLTFRLYKNVVAAVRKTGEGNPFKKYLDLDIGLSEENVHKMTQSIVKHGVAIISELRRLILIEDIVDSIKFGLFLWVLTYIGAWFNGMTLIIIADVAIFTIPKFYDVYKAEINKYLDLVKNKIKDIFKLVSEKIKLPGKKKIQ